MYDLDENFENKYQKFIDEMTKKADNYIAQHYGISPSSEDKVTENETPICTAKEFENVCKELGLEKD